MDQQQEHRFQAITDLEESFNRLGTGTSKARPQLTVIAATLIAALGFAGGIAFASITDESDSVEDIPASERLEVEQGTCGQGQEARECFQILPSERAREVDPDVSAADLLDGKGGGIPLDVLGEICEAIPEAERPSSPTCQSAGLPQSKEAVGGR